MIITRRKAIISGIAALSGYKALGQYVPSGPVFPVGTGCTLLSPGSNFDSFAGSASTPLATHNGCWIGFDTTNYEIGNLQLNGSGFVETVGIFSDGGAIYSGDTASTSQITVSGGASVTAAPVVRAITDTQSGYAATLGNITAGNYTFLTVFGNSIFSGGAGTWSTSSSHTITITAAGTGGTVTVTAFVDGTLVFTATDSSSPFINGSPGFKITADSTNVNDVLVSAWQDH